MSVLRAFTDGWRRVLKAPAVIAGLAAVQLLVVSPVAIDLMDADISLLDATAMDSSPSIVSVITHYEALVYAALMTFLLGGILDRLARDRATSSHGFFGACGIYFFRFIRLDALAVPFYLAVFYWAFASLAEDEEPSYAVIAPLVLVLNLVFDYAKVRMVVEDRRSAIGAVTSSLRFIKRHLGAAVNLYGLNVAAAVATYWIVASFMEPAGAVAIGYVVVRAMLRLVFAGSLIALFQSRLAHAGYTARPLPTWPESPSAEAIRPH